MPSATPLTRRRATTAAQLTVAVALSGALAATGAPPVWAGAAADRPALVSADKSPPQVRNVKFSRTSVAVRGLAVVPVRVSMRVTDPSGVLDNPHDMNPSPQLTLGAVPGHQAKLRPVLTRTSGNGDRRIWSATVNVPSTWTGRAHRLGRGDGSAVTSSPPCSPAPVPGPAVRGKNRPAHFHYSCWPGAVLRSTRGPPNTDTGRPIRRLPLAPLRQNCDFERRRHQNHRQRRPRLIQEDGSATVVWRPRAVSR